MIRLLSAAVLIALVGATIWMLPAWATLAVAALLSALAAGELATMAARLFGPVAVVFVAAAAAVVTVALVLDPRVVVPEASGLGAIDPLRPVLLALVVAGGIISLSLGPPSPATLGRAAVLVMAPLYVGLPLGAIALVQADFGPWATTWLLATIAVSDSAQYYAGRRFGRRKLAPAVSPAKTAEGAAGGLLAAALLGAFVGPLAFPGWSPLLAAGLALLLAAFGMTGDLFESLLKRGVGVKDSSHLIPGHGGVLDRIDSQLFAAPVFYLFLRYFA